MILASTQLWWHLARATGLVAWGLSVATVLWGLALSTRALGRRPRAPWLLDLHRFLGGATVVFVALHLLSLWADSYVTFGFRELLVPMASTWKPGAVTLGLIAFYLLIAVEVTSLMMQRFPRRLWHAVHLSSYLVFVAGSAHLLWAGTDADHVALRSTVAIVAAATLFFLVYRLVGPGRRASARPTADLQST
jgi:DMSO/TMAO reductase YedYZ heme-binding membrane subunit